MAEWQTQRRQLIETALAMNASGVNQGTSGNLSVRAGTGFLITPSGVPYGELSPEDLPWMDLDGQWQGPLKPSSEWRFHRDLYRHRPDAGAVLHAHPVHAGALACLQRDLPAFHYMVAVAGGKNIRCTPYATFGTEELSRLALRGMEGRKACLLGHHGLLCLERDLPSVLALAVEVEHLCRMYLLCLQQGEPEILPDEEMARVLEKFRHYGARAQGEGKGENP